MENEMVIRMEELTKRYGAQTAVDRLSLEVREGEVFGFLGPNGAGKTTTMLMLLGLTEPTSGQVRVCGFDPARNPLKVKALIGYLPENVGFYDDMDARQNLRYIARLNGIPDRVSAARIAKLLEEVDLAKESDKKVGSYSKGMRQRLGIAEVLVKEPRVVFLDEPTVGLDPDGTSRMLDLIHSLSRDRKMTIFFSSHLLDQVQRISDRIGIMIKGKLVAAGPLAELAQRGLGGEAGESYSLEEIYMKYFKEG
ncbi:MAG: ABC transporter ATP-binding protein [Deltaproteobacteria bacterium]|nr:ABC transporter ATP-binding protein [Deltaproteobacteria bacterium]